MTWQVSGAVPVGPTTPHHTNTCARRSNRKMTLGSACFVSTFCRMFGRKNPLCQYLIQIISTILSTFLFLLRISLNRPWFSQTKRLRLRHRQVEINQSRPAEKLQVEASGARAGADGSVLADGVQSRLSRSGWRCFSLFFFQVFEVALVGRFKVLGDSKMGIEMY